MSAKKKWNKTFAQMSTELSIPIPTLQKYDREGIDLNNPDAVVSYREQQACKRGNPMFKRERKVKPIDFQSTINGDDLNTQILRLRELLNLKHSQHADSLKLGNDALSSPILGDIVKLTETLVKIERATPEVNTANRDSIQIGELNKVLNETFGTMRQSLDAQPKRIAELAHGKSVIQIMEIVAKEMNVIIDDLFSCRLLKLIDDGKPTS